MYERELIINTDNFSVCFNSMQINYPTLHDLVSGLRFLVEGETVFIYLNVESLLKNISMVKDIEKKIYMSGDDLPALLSSKIINYAGHYKSFFRRNGFKVKVFLYMTDFKSSDFNEREINPDYRCYYLTKYNKNPKFVQLTEQLETKVIPMVSTILEFIPDVYFVNTLNIDSSMVPLVISEHIGENKVKNIIISSDMNETQYSFDPMFRMILLRRKFQDSVLTGSIADFISDMVKRPKTEILENQGEIYRNKGFYNLLLSVLGDKYRTVDGIMNIGYATLTKLILQGINENLITNDTNSPELLSSIFDPKDRDELIDNYNVLDISRKYPVLTKDQVHNITSKIIDRVDVASLQKINASYFNKYSLNLEALTQ